ncbi:hypothetical protein STHAL_05455 [Streptomyces halstedii]|uniref:Transposase n=1 Tax=Streptomyces halstedii TaxID=1944 RepID=A0ABS6TKZ2_STRHA|nr:hypothetical protein [Streptomyces halstedii]MBV7668941.1 hypothetical protein [Streptomyces halstedii]
MPPYQPSADWQYEIVTAGAKRALTTSRHREPLRHKGVGFKTAFPGLVNKLSSRNEDRLADVSQSWTPADRACNDDALGTVTAIGGRQQCGLTALSQHKEPQRREHRRSRTSEICL